MHREYLHRVKKHVAANPEPLHPVLQEFKDLIEGTPRIYMYFVQMWQEIPTKSPYNCDPTGAPQVRGYDEMLKMLNHILSRAPEWTDAAESVGMVGVPMCAIFDYAMGTPRYVALGFRGWGLLTG